MMTELRGLMVNESYWNMMIFCKDGTVAHNRMLVGLVFPQVSDEISVVCPDHTLQDIEDMIDNVLQPSEDREGLVNNNREKLVFRNVNDTDSSIFQRTSTEESSG